MPFRERADRIIEALNHFLFGLTEYGAVVDVLNAKPKDMKS